MTTTTDARVQFEGSEVTTPRVRTTARRALFWIVVAVVLVLFGVVALASTGVSTSSTALSATNPGPTGAEALVSVLRKDGVAVKAPRTLVAATADVDRSPASTTLVLYDPQSILTRAQLASLRNLSANLILILPNAATLDALAPSVSQAGYANPVAKADCGYAPVRRAGTVTGLAQAYRITTASPRDEGCLGVDSSYSLVHISGGEQTVTVLGATTTLNNQSIVENGNAALALGVFGSTTHLVWYLPSLADVSGTSPDGVIPNPPWVSLAIWLAALVLIAAAVWRGRRLGPIVVERMPVTVRSSETLEGRARLYQKVSARTHALDTLRIGTISRISVLCGLPTVASVDEVIGAASVVTGRSVASLRALLLDTVPTSDAGLVTLSDQLQLLETDVRGAVVPA